jgi:hypothetical protein
MGIIVVHLSEGLQCGARSAILRAADRTRQEEDRQLTGKLRCHRAEELSSTNRTPIGQRVSDEV